jgi:hypothetical protein
MLDSSWVGIGPEREGGQDVSRGRIAILLATVVGLGLYALQPAHSALATGAVTLNGNVANDCPVGFGCQGVTVSSCPGGAINGFYAVKSPAGAPIGTVLFFSGSGGTNWWAGNQASLDMLNQLVGEGYRVVQTRWATGWQHAPSGQQLGLAALACRPATLAKYVHDNLFTYNGTTTGQCGFCISGHSNGSSQAAYTLAFYGLDPLVDGLFPSSGPTYASLDKGCRGDAGYDYAGSVGGSNTVDDSYGFPTNGTGPCGTHNLSFLAQWTADGVATGGNDYSWPNTRVHIIEGTNDPYFNHALDFHNKLTAVGQAHTFQQISGMGHPLNGTGLAALHAAIIGGGGPPPTTTTTQPGSTTTTTVGTTTTTRPCTKGCGSTTTLPGGSTTTRPAKTTTTHP